MLYIKTFIAGIFVSAPLGPIALLIANLVFSHQVRRAIAIALGVAFADAIWGLLAALGVKATFHILAVAAEWLYIGGGILLCAAGFGLFKGMRSKPECSLRADKVDRLLTAFFFGFSLTMFNPLTLAGLVALFSVLGIASDGRFIHSFMAAFCLFVGASVWWGGLLVLFYAVKKGAQELFLRYANFVTSIILMILGLGAVIRGVFLLFY